MSHWKDWCVHLYSIFCVKTRLYTYLVFLHHTLNLIADFPSVVGHNEVWLLSKLVPAHLVIAGQLLFQANHELLGIRGSVQSAHLRKGKATPFLHTQNFSVVDFLERNKLKCISTVCTVWPTNLIKQGEDASGTALYEVQTALVILVLDKRPLQSLRHILLLNTGEEALSLTAQTPLTQSN